MTDARLRELERRWQETHSLADEVTLLRERLRAGLLTQERLELAAYLMHPAALLAVGGAKAGWADSTDPRNWLVGLHAWGGSTVLLACMGAFKLLPGHDDPLYLETAGETRAWLEDGAQGLSPARAKFFESLQHCRRAQTDEGHFLCKTLNGMTLDFSTLSPYYLRADDPERKAALRRSGRGQWQYSFTYRGDDRWWHVLHGAIDPSVGVASSRLVECSPRWAPAARERTVPNSDERTPLDEFLITRRLIELDQAAPGTVARGVAVELLPWVLSTGAGSGAAP